MGKWNKHPPRKRSKLSPRNFPSDSAWRYALFRERDGQIQEALNVLRLKGFKLYINTENHSYAVPCFGCMFEFKKIIPTQAREFVAWVSSEKSSVSAPLPAEIERIRIPKQTTRRAATPSFRDAPSVTERSAPAWYMNRAVRSSSTGHGGFWYSTVPGHYAPLNWYDLCPG
jgi:hypothetical protein